MKSVAMLSQTSRNGTCGSDSPFAVPLGFALHCIHRRFLPDLAGVVVFKPRHSGFFQGSH